MRPGLLEHYLSWGVSIFLAGVWLSRLLVVGLNLDKIPEISGPDYDLAPREPLGHVPRVSIVVAARNEADHIEAALRSLLELDYPDYEVIAVDDRSDDETGEAMDLLSESRPSQPTSGSRLQVLHIEHLPAGWLGKTHAMWRGAQITTGDWILFTDADVVFRSDALRRAIAYAEREKADHAVLFPTMVMSSAGERMMIAFFQSQFVFARLPWKVSDPKSRDAIGVGAFNLIRRQVYERIGTYERMRLEILDDMRLGEIVKQEGFRQRVAFGRGLLRLRWVFGAYGMVRNLTKNGFAILRFNGWFLLLAVCGILLVNVGPYVGAMFAPGWARAGFGVALATLIAIYVGMSWHSDVPPYYVLLHPIGALLFCYALVRSAVLTLLHDGVDWRGTHYSLAELREFRREQPWWSWL
ncbi:MAG TPA: glycosyltransferase family 2 protein [Candidatus Binatia bacterium]|nr:glycosyltransferase family 2 protein [Candidatus Binatia bacterium]